MAHVDDDAGPGHGALHGRPRRVRAVDAHDVRGVLADRPVRLVHPRPVRRRRAVGRAHHEDHLRVERDRRRGRGRDEGCGPGEGQDADEEAGEDSSHDGAPHGLPAGRGGRRSAHRAPPGRAAQSRLRPGWVVPPGQRLRAERGGRGGSGVVGSPAAGAGRVRRGTAIGAAGPREGDTGRPGTGPRRAGRWAHRSAADRCGRQGRAVGRAVGAGVGRAVGRAVGAGVSYGCSVSGSVPSGFVRSVGISAGSGMPPW